MILITSFFQGIKYPKKKTNRTESQKFIKTTKLIFGCNYGVEMIPKYFFV